MTTKRNRIWLSEAGTIVGLAACSGGSGLERPVGVNECAAQLIAGCQ